VPIGLFEDPYDIVLTVYEKLTVEVDGSPVDVRRATAVDVADSKRIGRRDLVQVVKE